LNAKIREEIAENKGSTIWSERRVKLSDCVKQKNRAKIGNAWEKKYTEFESYDEMLERGTPQFNWQQNQLSNGPGSLNVRFGRSLQRIKRVPYGVNGERNLLIVWNKRGVNRRINN